MGRSPGSFTPESLAEGLRDLVLRGRVYVGFSGGADSTALLLALHSLSCSLDFELQAIHVNHGVHPDADEWVEHCESICASLGIPIQVAGPPKKALEGDGPEAALRNFRYTEFSRRLEAEDVLCTAHHRRDQAETLMLALLRGSGPAGLAAMPFVRPLGSGRLARPLLHTDPEPLWAWLQDQDVHWIEDPSNAVTDADRNYLRSRVMPLLRDRWPALDRSLEASATLQAETRTMLDEAADRALAEHELTPGVLALQALEPDSPALRALIRHWVKRRGAVKLPRSRLAELTRQLRTSTPEQDVESRWSHHCLKHYRDLLWLDPSELHAIRRPLVWGLDRDLTLDSPAGTLEIVERNAGGSKFCRSGDDPGLPTLEVRSRRPGDRFRATPNTRSQSLKSWLSQSPIPPWWRDGVPMADSNDGLAFLGDVVFDPALARQLEDRGLALRWNPTDPALAWAWRRCRKALLGVK